MTEGPIRSCRTCQATFTTDVAHCDSRTCPWCCRCAAKAASGAKKPGKRGGP